MHALAAQSPTPAVSASQSATGSHAKHPSQKPHAFAASVRICAGCGATRISTVARVPSLSQAWGCSGGYCLGRASIAELGAARKLRAIHLLMCSLTGQLDVLGTPSIPRFNSRTKYSFEPVTFRNTAVAVQHSACRLHARQVPKFVRIFPVIVEFLTVPFAFPRGVTITGGSYG